MLSELSTEAEVVLVVGLISATAGLIGALGGTVIGSWLNGRSQRRSEKRAAFVEVLAAMHDCQQACTELSIAITGERADQVGRLRDRLVIAVHRVETAGNLAMLAVGREHEEVFRNGMIACAEEVKTANHRDDSRGSRPPGGRSLSLAARSCADRTRCHRAGTLSSASRRSIASRVTAGMTWL
jgi:hypothetical protein